ncbi:MAG: hypothetical protein ABLT11_04290 [Candidatus Acidiferrum sp.]
MGNEMKCRVRSGKRESDGKALLETSEIIFRGDFRLKISFALIRSAKVVNGKLQLRTAEGLTVFELGEGTAEKWCEKILHPKSRIEKLGVKAGARVALVGFGKADEEFLKELGDLTKAVKKVSESGVPADVEWIFFKAETQKELSRISKIAKAMRGAAALWVVYPKGNPRGLGKVTEGDVLAAGRAGGLKDIKVVGFSATATALKFVIPVSQR